jgi:NRAMP (natural resistance-associated macrophage protein)-like metal ion transporter
VSKNFFHKIKEEAKTIGPGFITGTADDDPSGIATYSIAGAKFGYGLCWLSWFLLPMMIAVQEMCARIGIITGEGLAAVLKKHYPKKVLLIVVFLLAVANTINIAANLGIMAASLKMIVNLPFIFWLLLVSISTVLFEIFVPYRTYAKFLRWAAFFLLVYVVTAFLVTRDWLNVLSQTIIPHFELNKDFFATGVGFIGTTISPYLFFWQTSEEVEEEIVDGKIKDFDAQKPSLSSREIRRMRQDTDIGMLFSEIITFFIVATAAATFHVNGITNIETPHQAALALKPLAGDLTYLLFTLGIVGMGLQSIPILAGTVGYAVSETLGVPEGLSKSLGQAKLFYGAIATATIIGVLINLLNINTIKALLYAAIVNGVISVPLIFIILNLADNPKIVGTRKSPLRIRLFGWLAFFFALFAVIFMIVGNLGLLS